MAKKKTSETSEDLDFDDLYNELASETGGDVLSQLDTVKYRIDTGNLAINYSCSGKCIGGGLPGNRITEAFGGEASGKSLIGSNILGSIQKMNGWAIILDCENAINGDFMERISHVNLKRLIRYSPPTLEKAFRQIHVTTKKIREREKEKNLERRPILFVFDSLTVPPCERELRENNLPLDYNVNEWKKIVGRQEQPGERARLISSEMRKLQSMVADQDVTVYLINQTRDKIGVMYGCHFGLSRVYLADGSTMPIKKIVKNKLPVEVLSYNMETGAIEAKPVIDWHDNGLLPDGESFLKIKFRRNYRNAFGYLQCTRNHVVFKYQGDSIVEVPAETIEPHDKLALVQPRFLSEDQWQLVYGSLLGDGEIRRSGRNRNPQLRFSHGKKQEDYIRFKSSLMGNLMAGPVRDTNHNSFESESTSLYELNAVADYKKDYMIPQVVADNLNEFGLAIWYLDDGNYSGNCDKWGIGKSVIYCTKYRNREIMLKAFERLGLKVKLFDKGFQFDSENTLKFHQMIARFVPESMNYKIHPKFHGLYGFDFVKDLPPKYDVIPGEVLEVSVKNTKSRRRYDLTVDGNSTYVTAGAIVHNSPETTPGGNAVKFYSSLRIRTAAKKKIENKALGKFSGINMQVKNVKNRGFRPFVVADDVKLYFESGIDPISGLLNCLIEGERVEMKGKGNFLVKPDFLPEGMEEYKFKASKGENRLPVQVILDCPKLVDASSTEEVQKYLDNWSSGLAASESGDYGEKSMSFDADGNPFESDDYDDDIEESDDSEE